MQMGDHLYFYCRTLLPAGWDNITCTVLYQQDVCTAFGLGLGFSMNLCGPADSDHHQQRVL